jgi:hypothetical protein
MDDRHLDVLFREKLSEHEITPSPKAWSKLEQQLGKKEKPIWLVWGNYAAGFVLLVGIGIGIQYWNRTVPELEKELLAEIPLEQPSPLILTDTMMAPEVADTPNTSAQSQPAQKKTSPPNPETSSTNIPNQQVASLPMNPSERLEESLPPIDQREEIWSEAIALDQYAIPLEISEIMPEVLSQENEIAYTVRIVSRGYAIAPDKGQLVEEIESKLEKIGGFLTKVDKGFGELQDAKNDLLFQVMASRKEK